ncbi:MAG: MarP family serine protease [Nocardioides sp.]|nr:MarP family serine protease [Nocardioides sp.]
MNVLDWILVFLVFTYALSGYWQGFVTGAFATAGLLMGGLLGIWLAPIALGDADPSIWVSLGALFIVILSATLGQAFLQYAGARVREQIRWQPVRAVDAIGGALLSAAAVLLVAWALGVAVSGTKIGSITPMVRDSMLLAKVDRALPERANRVLNSFNKVVGTNFFPQYLEPFAPERIVEVAPPPKGIARDPDVEAASESVLKIHGDNSCGRGVEGSGFVYADGRVMTNAHVLAGVDDPQVLVGDEALDARVVYYNSDLDVAVLSVDGLDRPRLGFDTDAKKGQGAAVLGYPQDGPYDVQPARIRNEQRLRSPDIYGNGSVLREVFSVRGLIRPGNSGGPLVNSKGDVIGVVFAASVTDENTGYALTAEQVSDAAGKGATSRSQVDTGGCAG